MACRVAASRSRSCRCPARSGDGPRQAGPARLGRGPQLVDQGGRTGHVGAREALERRETADAAGTRIADRADARRQSILVRCSFFWASLSSKRGWRGQSRRPDACFIAPLEHCSYAAVCQIYCPVAAPGSERRSARTLRSSWLWDQHLKLCHPMTDSGQTLNGHPQPAPGMPDGFRPQLLRRRQWRSWERNGSGGTP
jgi:hypothetical protein